MGDFKLFFYGMLATVVVWISAVVVMLGLMALVFGGVESIGAWICIVMGLGIGFYAQAMRFTFRRQSGHIIYSGGSW